MNTLMIQGTMSDAGKSLLVTALCRYYRRRGYRVSPFKAQNMSLNCAVTKDGGEIGRAQALQAVAAGIAAHSDMNPVLLKPQSDCSAQVIIHGQTFSEMNAGQYQDYKKIAMNAVLTSHQRLTQQYDLIIAEGAGSPAEINLRENDIANMGFAEAIDCPVVLIADIDRGGVFAQFIGTLELLSASERARIKGFVINKFRGDIKLLAPGIQWLEEKTNIPVLGVLPMLTNFHLDAEDAIQQIVRKSEAALKVVVITLPHISNHTDFDNLKLQTSVEVTFANPNYQTLPKADCLILPGTKNVIDDLQWLKNRNWDQQIKQHLRYGGRLIGLCGGLQMLGKAIHNPHQLETPIKHIEGLNLLDFETTLEKQKQRRHVSGQLNFDNASFYGYEIHQGQSSGPALARALCRINNKNDGVVSEDQQIIGTYVHGIFDAASAMKSLLKWLGLESENTEDYALIRERNIERLADEIESWDWQQVVG